MGATLAAGAMVLAACNSAPEPTNSPTSTAQPTAGITAGPTASSTLTPEPSESPTDTETFERRDANMTDGEALARLLNPATGETWFFAPREIPTPSWAVGDSYLDSNPVRWYEIGQRGTRTIVSYSDDYLTEVFERTLDGTWEWIAYPSGRDAVTGDGGATFGFPEVPINDQIYYDSLTLPAQFTLPSGEPLLVPDFNRGGLAVPGYTVATQPESDVVDTIGGYRVERYRVPVDWVWADAYGTDEPEDLAYDDLFYVLTTPYGAVITLTYLPFEGFDDVTWNITVSLESDTGVYMADINDSACGLWDHDHNTVLIGILDTDWIQAGTTSRGENVYVMTETHPLAAPMFLTYVAAAQSRGETPRSFEQFTDAPGIVGYKSSDADVWIAYLNGAYSGRAWC